jgi:membrane-bound ClpP family serine protease
VSVWVPIALQAGALIVGLAEALIPSMGLLALVALGLLGSSWFIIVRDLSSAGTMAFLAADIIIIPITIKFAFTILKSSPLALRKQLAKGSGLEQTIEPDAHLIGLTGIVDAQLRPTGKAIFNGKVYEVTCEDDVLEKGTPIQVSRVVGNKIIVTSEILSNLK